MKLKGVLGASLVVATVLASACGQEESAPLPEQSPAAVRVNRQFAKSDYNKVLVLGSSAAEAENSPEAQAVLTYNPNAVITGVGPAEWATKTASQFSQYHAIIITEGTCQSGTAGVLDAAAANRTTWGPVVDSEVVIVGTDPVNNGAPDLMQAAIQQAVINGVQYYTSLYISLGCAYQDAPANTPVPVLEPFGDFKVQGVPNCADWGHRFTMYPSLFSDTLSFDGLLYGNGCVARSVFTTYPVRNLTAAVIATDSTGENPIPGAFDYEDFEFGEFFRGTPYVLIRNASAVGAGCGGDSNNVPSGEECDLGDGQNGQRGNSCSFSCRLEWCGDGNVDTIWGEECDNGTGNQRTPQGDIVNGNCSAFCKLIDVPAPPSSPPVARCKSVTVMATNTCGVPADINDGSSDPDGDLVECVQSPEGPYAIGDTTVTLMCRDAAEQTASCSAVVTVTDKVLPTVTPTPDAFGNVNQSLECNRNAQWSDPGATANDLCSGPVTPVEAAGLVRMGVPDTYTRTYTARDSAGNVGTATRTVVISDTLPPLINVGAGLSTVECGQNFFDPTSVSDQCASTVPLQKTGSVNTGVVGEYPITYTATDPSGNAAEPKNRTVTVRDTRRPTVTVNAPTSMTVECNDPNFVDPGATATDSCAGALPATPVQPPNLGTPGTHNVFYKATDPSGNEGTSTTSRVLTVQDTLPPVLTVNPGPNTLECATAWTDPGATANDQCAGDLPVTASGTVDTHQLTEQTITYSADDGRGHTVSATRTVTVQDTQAPAITITGELTPPPVECGGGYTDPGATADDACAGALPAVAEPPADPNVPGTYNVRYRATDLAGNTTLSSSTRVVTVSDTLAPVVTLNGAAAMGLECATPYNELGATANDQCVGPLTVSIDGSVDNMQLGAQALTYSATDGSRTGSATRTVTVSDSLAPDITLNGPLAQAVECGDPAYVDLGATANDACAGTVAAVPEPPANPNVPNTYTVRYRATDPSGNTALSADSRTVTVSDTLPPTLTLQGANPQQVECGTAWADPGSTASDQCAGPLTATVAGGVNHQEPAAYPVTYTVNDGQGHIVTQTRTVNVSDTLPPTIEVVGPVNDSFACGSTYVDPGATANDACDGDLPVTATQEGNSDRPGTFTITYSARDEAGHEVTSPVQRQVTVSDDAPPTLVLLGNELEVTECADAWTDPWARADDACFGDVTDRIQRSGELDLGAPGEYGLTYNVSDPAGQAAQPANRTVKVQDTQRPVVTVNGPLEIPVECGSNTYTDPGASASDACAGTLPAVPSTTANPDAPGSYTISYSATDPSGNVGTSSASRTVTVSDTLPPMLTLNEGPNTLECATPWNDPGATANDQCAGTLAVTRTGSVDSMQLGPQMVTYSADDGSHVATQSRTVTVSDTLAPTITVLGPENDSFACGSTYVDPGATATDACAGSVPVTAEQNGDPSRPGSFTITYSATDPSNNSVTSPVTRTVTVNDDAPPTLVLLGSTAPTLECGTAFVEEGYSADDACFGDVTNRVVVGGSVDSNTPGAYPLTYNVTDPAGQSAPEQTRTVTVQDTLAPSITVLGELSQQLQCDHAPYADPGATATDACAGDLTAAIQTIGGVNTGAAGSYTLTYRVTDLSGNTTTSSDVRTVTVVDDLPPTITLQGGSPAAHECGSPYADPGATANDACAGDLTANITRTGSVDGNATGQYTIDYTVTDPSNLTAATQRVVNVNDTLPPVLTLLGDASQIVECGPGYADPGATATDACAGDLDARIQVSGAADSTVVGDYTVSYTVADNAGHTAGPLTRNVQVRDTQAPAITVNGPLEDNFDCGSTYVDPGATASDVCAGAVPVTATQTGDADRPGSFTITYSATDPSNNTATSPVTRTVHVNDDAAPTLVLVGEERPRLECGTSWNDPGAQANDACFGNLTGDITVSGTVNVGVPNDYPLVYNVTDGAGNSAPSVNRTVEVRDTQVPTIAVTGPASTTYECGTTYVDPGATATDACAGDLTSAIVATQTQDPNAPANFTVTYSVTDPSGNTAVSPVTRTVTVNDTQAPAIALNGPASQNLECSPGPYSDPGATATDTCPGDVQVSVAGAVNTRVRGTYTLSYSARDGAGNTSPTVNRTVTISDNLPPSITLNGESSITLECRRDTYTELGATATDICSTATIDDPPESNVNANAVGAYLVRYTARDESGNTNVAVRNVLVEDHVAPVITVTNDNAETNTLECGVTQWNDPLATALDSCQGDVSSSVIVEFSNVVNRPVGNYRVDYQARDAYGNTAHASRNVSVQDTLGPVLTVTGQPIEQIECGGQPALGVTATDACEGDVSSRIVASPATLPNEPGVHVVTYTATDSQGHASTNTATRTFEVVDTTLPELVVNGPTELFYECTGHAIGNVWSNPGASATDTCEGELLVHQYNTGDDDGDGIPGMYDPDDFGPGPTTEVEGLYYVQYLAWDESYNIQGAILSVYVQDTLKPVLYLNGAETVQTQCFFPTDDPTDSDEEVDVDPNPYVDEGATGEDQCYGDVTPSVMTFSTVDKSSPGRYTVEYQVRDGAFNWADPITRTVQVIDNQSPKIKANAPINLGAADLGMRRVQLSECGVVWDRCAGYMNIMDAAMVNVTSNEQLGGDEGDIVFDPNDGTFFVRAERNADGSPRVYTATWRNFDPSGNFVTGTCRMYVPVNQDDPPPALQSGSDMQASR